MENLKPSQAEVKVERPPKSSNVSIVQLQPDSWEILRELKLRSLEQEPIAFEDQSEGMARYSARTEEEWKKKLDEELSSTISVFAEDNGKYIGMVNAVINHAEEKALIQHMYVDAKDYRGQGIGRQLLEVLIQKLKDRGDIKKAELAVLETQTPAIRLYESLGFQKVGEAEARRGNDTYTELEMELKL